LVEALRGCDAGSLDACLSTFATAPAPGLFAEAGDWMAACYAAEDVAAIRVRLAAHPNPLAQQAAEVIGRRSPSSLKITLHALRTAEALGSLEACLDREFRMALVRTHQHDFIEGVRAAVVDKDRNPRWSPARLDEISGDDVAMFFAAAEAMPALTAA
jgi:enoyl-CoA hydratase